MSRARLTVERAIRSLPVDSYLLAVSGGKDSMTLFHAAYTFLSQSQYRFQVAHIDHGLRPHSADDADFVKSQCEERKIPFHLLKATPPGEGENIEAWGRNLRYEFFQKIRKEADLSWTLTAHHSEDMVETILMRLISNKEPVGIQFRDERRKVLRPFLKVSKEEIGRYINLQDIPYREDESNQDTNFLRNKVRQQLFPYLKEHFGNSSILSLSDQISSLHEDMECLKELSQKTVLKTARPSLESQEGLRLFQSLLRQEHEALRWRMVSKELLPFLDFPLGREHGKKVVEFLLSNQRAVEVPGGTILCRKNGAIVIQKKIE